MNNYITASCYATSTDKFNNHVFECSNVAKVSCFKFYGFMTVYNENNFKSYLHKMGFDRINF